MGWSQAALRLAGVGALVAVMSSCGGAGTKVADLAGVSTTASPATTTIAVSVAPVDLSSTIVLNAPAGFVALASEPYGSFDLDRFLADFSETPDIDRATLSGLRRGHARAWLNEDRGAVFAVFVFEFGDASGAASSQAKSLAHDVQSKGATRFTVADIAGAVGETYLQETDQGPQLVHSVLFIRGERLYQVAAQYVGKTTPAAELANFARAQDQVAR